MIRTILVLLAVAFVSCEDSHKSRKSDTPIAKSSDVGVGTVSADEIEITVFKNDTLEGPVADGWGFDLLVNGKRLIHQPTVPVVTGNIGFQSEVQALKAGELVSVKIINGIMPPSLDRSDLKSLGIDLP